MKILLSDAGTVLSNNDISLDCLKEFGETVYYDSIDRQTLIREIGKYDAVLCNKTVIDRTVLEAADKLKYIGLFATGYNNIDIECARERGVTVCNAGSYSTDAVAQQVFAYLLEHYTKLSQYNELVHSGGWITSPTFSMLTYPTDELAGKTIGLVGCGNIGKAVAEIARAFKMRVLAFVRTPKVIPGVETLSFDELLESSDIISVHCPLNSDSESLFNSAAFEKMKDGAYFINTARGAIVDDSALCRALCSGKLSGAAIDVLRTEPMEKDCVLLKAPNLIITPHTAWAPLSTRRRLLEIVSNNIRGFLNGKPQNKIV